MSTVRDIKARSSKTEQAISQYIDSLETVLRTLDAVDLEHFATQLLKLQKSGNTLYICGNGGSAANALHIANDFTFGINPQGSALRVEALPANSSVLTCLGNDIGYENIFSHQLKVKGKPGDLLLVLSGSGNSKNIINALEAANSIGIKTVGILGFQGGLAKPLLDLCFHFVIDDMQVAEDTQLVVGHLLMKILKEKLQEQ
ncbi:hypothetical protein N480_01300 [Pseudoalteromonas luteoviolacea S2607]|uniref:SIS domain-containing protein n=1 Tax=Pseudoalteromonas luteoviolacea TaxID=43657 RepID=UPI0007B08722|nr:SIS domain-containing protein [Pseudoalteromonas luteoviolacea]KZN39499.1 hypothetical protein N480_01300 [Pseudoalteromonas luteoviolacea S2607]